MNNVSLIGRITKDIEIRYTQGSNTAVSKFNIAVDKKVKAGEEKKADFIQCQAWGKTAEFIGKYFSKGQKIALIGRIETNNWEDKDGKKHYDTFVTVENVEFCEGKRDSEGQAQKETQEEFSKYETDLPF